MRILVGCALTVLVLIGTPAAPIVGLAIVGISALMATSPRPIGYRPRRATRRGVEWGGK